MPDATRQSILPGRFRWLAVLLGVASLACAGLAAVEFRSLQHIILVDVPLSEAELSRQPDSICGQFRTGLPKYRLRWDGEPPRAWLADHKTGEPLAPPLMSENSLSLNARGVLWRSNGDCRFVIDRETFVALGNEVVLRVEKYASRSTFYTWAIAAISCALLAFISYQQIRIYRTAPALRTRVRWDEGRSLAFVLISLASVIVFFPGHPVAHMSGDPANIHSFAAGLDAPQEFARDSVLSDPRNYQWYTPLYVKLVQCFGWMGFHYATSRAFLVLVSTLAGLFGYYHLFRLASRSSAFAFCATLGLWFLKVQYPPNENWGPMLVLPRTVYGALLPWVILLALRCLNRPNSWWISAAASGLLFYVHPVSSPALTGAILTAFVFGGPGHWLKRVGWGVVGAVAALGVMYPYVRIYTSKYSGTVVESAELTRQAFEIAKERFAPGYLEPLVFYRDFGLFVAANPRYWFGIAALILLCRYRPRSLTTRVSVGMTVGYFIVTCLIPTLDVLISQQYGRLPFQIDLIRNLRYLDVWLLGMVAALVREVGRTGWGRGWTLQFQIAATKVLQSRSFSWKLVPTAAAMWAVLFFFPSFCRSSYRLCEFGYDNVTILIGKPHGELEQDIEAFRALRTMRGSKEVVGGTFHLRQMQIPVAYNNKDLGVLAYSSPAALVQAKNVLNQSAIRMIWPVDQTGAVDQAAILGADILLLKRNEIAPSLARSDRVLFQNASNVLIRVDPKQVLARREALRHEVIANLESQVGRN
ncbi:MAG: rane protein of unknown function [Planctomycetaceae bacterium]|nr:rane protein of unknown function [Planctomycetaceae bacterium]